MPGDQAASAGSDGCTCMAPLGMPTRAAPEHQYFVYDACSMKDLKRDYAAFLAANPTYAETTALDTLRNTEFRRLDEQQLVYLDYTGGGLYPSSLVLRHAEFLATHVLGNPHSANPASALAGERIEICRAHVLRFFNASAEEYAVVFTANASHALKLVARPTPSSPAISCC